MVAETRTEVSLTESELKLITGRNKFVEEAKEGGRIIHSRSPFHTILVRALEVLFIAQTSITGKKNLDFIRERIGTDRITFAGNHTSDADHPSLENALLKNGYGSVANQLLFASGLKMWGRPQTAWAVDGFNTFPTSAPGYYDDIAVIEKRFLSDNEKDLLGGYRANLDWLNSKSFKAILPDWKNGKAIVVVYPESTRSRYGFIERGREEAQAYFRHGLILPFMIDWPGEAFPSGGNPNWDLILGRYKGEKGWTVSVAFGEPISGEELNNPRTKDWLSERRANMVDFVMSRVAVLNPDRVDPEYRPLYQSLTAGIPQGLLISA